MLQHLLFESVSLWPALWSRAKKHHCKAQESSKIQREIRAVKEWHMSRDAEIYA